MNILLFLAGLLGLFYAIARHRIPLRNLALISGLFLAVFTLMGGFSLFWGLFFWILLLVPAILFGVDQIRREFLSEPLLRRISRVLPQMSETERAAIEAGNVWWEAELFRGSPDWRKLQEYSMPKLSEEEQAFIDGPVEELCAMIDDWDITHRRMDLPPEVWDYMKQHRFFGMIIPRQYGGLEFSAHAHSCVVTKLSARSISAGVTVMVPNSLGPAELLLHYGTDEQKDHYLPRLADGREIPCFALTGPDAGSDASAIPDTGVVCKGQFDGREVLGLRLNWEKRYITLGPVATVLGLAFRALDPDGLLGDEEDLGITCALIPVDTPGITIGRRHFPLNAAFQNGPNSGKDVFIPLEYVIGGQQNIGRGWRMLVESLSAGRGISLPAVGASAGKAAARTTGAYAHVRKQFNTSIGRFEGVEEALARIGGLTYMMEAGRLLTLAALDAGEKPSVVTAILKYYNTEWMRQVVNDAMDVHGGRGICMGPTNYLARAYQTLPVGITVEGANILTRSMIIFGQGAIRCHPFLVREMMAAGAADEDNALGEFDAALSGHAEYFVTNWCRAFIYGISGSHLAPAPYAGRIGAYYRRLGQMSAAFAVTADLVLMILGGAFKRREKLSGRFADAMGYMYYASAALKKFETDGQPRGDLPLVEWSVKYSLYQVQMALDEILRNFPLKWLGVLVRHTIFPLGLSLRQPNDYLSHRVASLLIRPGEARDRLTDGLYISNDPEDITGCLEDALQKVVLAEPIERRLRHDRLAPAALESHEQWLQRLEHEGLISAEEAAIVTAARAATRRVIMVDDFAPEQMLPGASASGDAPARAKPALKKSARTKTAAKKAAAKKTAGKKSAAKKPVSKPAANGGEDGQQETET
ncbi:MAG: acyl-CoA dehydrogenase [Gammaproteobacteria bacterium]|nr:acyl-CoA dehydrogenase [Gammaproteobacteria bacterium]